MLTTKKENEILLKLFKEFSKDYNANSISKVIKITPRGALKILKNLEKQGIIKSRKLGKAVFYKINFNDAYVCKIIETLLIAESREKAGRWLEEFKDIFKDTQIIIIFGSVIRNPKEANDVDILFVFEKDKYKYISRFVIEKNKILVKKIHNIPQTMDDLKDNLKNNKAIQDAIGTGYVLYGHDKIVEVIKNVASV